MTFMTYFTMMFYFAAIVAAVAFIVSLIKTRSVGEAVGITAYSAFAATVGFTQLSLMALPFLFIVALIRMMLR